jgi:RNA polymerase sigma-70 factor (ECF subfamily)
VQCCSEQAIEQCLAAAYAPLRPGQRSAGEHVLDSLPDKDIEAAMQTLPLQFRGVVYYADLEGFRYQEIAAMVKSARESSVATCRQERWTCGRR